MLYLRALLDEGLWQTVIPGYSDGHRLLHENPHDALIYMTDKMHEIRARGWFEYPGERRHALKDLLSDHAWEDRAQARLKVVVDKTREGMV